MLGHILTKYLKTNSNFQIFSLSRENVSNYNDHFICDIKDELLFKEICKEIKPDIVINCIGILIKGSNKSIKNAVYINSYFPHFLNEISSKLNFKIIHISTDCVFSGDIGGYSEDSIKDSKDVYGLTKSLGEIQSSKHLTIRTSIIGPELKIKSEGLFNWFLKQNGKILGYSNVIWSGVTTLELSKIILYSISNDINGLWNVSSLEPISKYELLKIIKKRFSMNNIIITKDTQPVIDKSMISNRKIDYIVPSYHFMIDELFNFIDLNKRIYNNYLNASRRT